jgi:tryptophan 2,3-dioxygenase
MACPFNPSPDKPNDSGVQGSVPAGVPSPYGTGWGDPAGAPAEGVGRGRLTYGSYLKVPELLALQQELSLPVHHDELLFIISHQVYELWFKQMLHELRRVCALIDADRPDQASQTFHRLHAIQALLIAQLPVLETMDFVEFRKFREHLRPASGFQSVQFRLVEFLSGAKNPRMITLVGDDQDAGRVMQDALSQPTVYDHLLRLLSRRGLPIPQDILSRDVSQSYPGDPRVVEAILPVYEHADQHYPLFRLCEHLVEYDERFSLWRFHHVKMVERMIGGMVGTGGSSGAKYLMGTVQNRLYTDLWAVRDRLGTAPA